MIGLNFVCERDELLYSLDLHIELKNNFSLDYLDFDNQSFEDIIDYMEFLEFEQYIFVALEENVRLKRLVSYLSDKINYPIFMLDMNNLTNILSEEEVTSVKKSLESHSIYQNVMNLDTEKVFRNGYKAFMSALYPNLTKGLLKHLQVDQLDSFLAKNQDLILHFAINSAIYTDHYYDNIKIPLIVKSLINFNVERFEYVTASELNDALEQFLSSGHLNMTNNILDFGVLSGISTFNSLVYKNDNFYLDSATNILIGHAGDTYQQLFNEASMKLTRKSIKGTSDLHHLFPLLIAINRSFDSLEFITPYNNYQIEGVEHTSISLKWIAFKNTKNYFAYNIKNGRLFKIDSVVFEKIEHIIKNRFNERDSEMKKVTEVLKYYG